MDTLQNIINQLDNLADNPISTYHYLSDLEPDSDIDNDEADYNAFCDYAEQYGAADIRC